MITRKQYMADSANLHQAYYLELANDCGITITDQKFLDRCKRAIDNPNGNGLNNIALSNWDGMALGAHAYNRRSLDAAHKLHGDFWSLCSGVCMLKAVAQKLVDDSRKPCGCVTGQGD